MDEYPWQTCAQCGKQTSWTTNEYSTDGAELICSACNKGNKETWMNSIREYNTEYASEVRRMAGQTGGSYAKGFAGSKYERLNEATLTIAHELAAGNVAAAHSAPERLPVPTHEVECGKCAGTGVFHLKNARTEVDGSTVKAVCFPCGGKGRMTVEDQWRTNTYWAKYARI